MNDPELEGIARELERSGGRAYLVGGIVRDRLLGLESKDLDVEVHGLEAEKVEQVLRAFGEVITIGKAFGVYRIKGLDVDFSLPREDSKTGPGHRGFEVRVDPGLDLAAASRRRDLTINSMAIDLLTGELFDPHGGCADLHAGILRATDRDRFADDPLRGLRVAQMGARFELRPDPELLLLCSRLDLSELPGERMLEEFRKLLLKGVRPSIGLEILRESGMIRFFPELSALVGVPQEPDWHPEGDVWTHTLLVVDAAARMRDGSAEDQALMFGALCHDLGKPSTTVQERGRLRSPAHAEDGAEISRVFLGRLAAPHDLIDQVSVLTRFHLLPLFFVTEGATDRAYRRLSRRLAAGKATLRMLERVARADHLGRTTDEARSGEFKEGDRFLERARQLEVQQSAPVDVVRGRDLLARGFRPGPEIGRLLARCREIQDETGWTDPDRIVNQLLANSDGK
ncbi:MAG: HD domain-containing protein [Planctomycetota bacterium]